MNGTIPTNEALVPRRDRPHRWQERDEPVEPDFEPAPAYAPPGAEMRARVRRLGDDDTIRAREVGAAGEAGPTVEASGQSTETVRTEDGRIVLTLRSEVTILGDLPDEGIAVETTTLLKPGEKI